MCPRDKFEHSFETMSMECFERIVDNVSDFGVKSMAFGIFGEPFLDVHLESRLKFVKSKFPDMQISMNTTANLLEGKKIDIVCEYADIIKISNYGFTKETYEKIHRGSIKFESVKRNIDIFLNLEKRPFAIMAFLDLPQNHDELDIWKKYYYPKCNRLDIWKPHNWGGEGVIYNNDNIISTTCKRVLKLNDLTFHTDGSVSICCLDFNRKLIIGNVMKSSIIDMIKGEKYRQLQEIHKNNLLLKSNLICRDCDYLKDRSDALIYSSSDKMKIGESSMQILCSFFVFEFKMELPYKRCKIHSKKR